ncbi:GNAT family N-acetyltransferase [Pantoea sp. 1.19]|uniref:GNAT family N-acetyltransferase n=1 Tax=Pantoea sp. 1.19 TaxID=1925589 RepID=UPI0009FA2904|nr:GNAT family N-acetyltransferase [Pantoea sp. 1.19]
MMKDTVIDHPGEQRMSCQITVASQDDWREVEAMARSERWNLGQGDSQRFQQTDSEGFFVHRCNDRVVASVSVANLADDYAHLGHYIVHPAFRGRGWGLKLWSHAIDHAGARCIGLDGMPEQEKNYARWGFKTHYHTWRLCGKAFASPHSPQIAPVAPSDDAAVARLDAEKVGYRRSALLRDWFSGDGRLAFCVRIAGQVVGLVALRPADEGYRLGPLYADDPAMAEALFTAALNALPAGTAVTLDVPEQQTAFLQRLQQWGFTSLFHTCRMYRGTPPVSAPQGICAIASLELG